MESNIGNTTRIKIYSIHFNRPDFIGIQIDSFKRFVKNEFDFLVVNNSCDSNIEKTCEDLQICCINLNNKDLNPSESHSLGLNELKKFIKNDGNIHVILDHDMFIIEDIDFFDYMGDKSIMFIEQKREELTYMWPGLIVINSNLCPNLQDLDFSFGIFEGIRCDSGGQSYKYLRENSNLNRKTPSETVETDDINDLNSFFFVYDRKFLHYFRGSNWVNMEDKILSKKNNRLKKIIYE